MARSPDKRIIEAEALFRKGYRLVDIAKELDLPPGTVRRWKSTHNWDSERSSTNKANVRNKHISEKSSDGSELNKENVIDKCAGLNDKQSLFCLFYIRNFNATQAYKKAYGCSYATAMVEGSKSLRKPKIKSEIERLKKERMNQIYLDESDIFEKYIRIAFADITDYLEFGQEEIPVISMYGPVMIKDEDTGEQLPLTKMVNTVRFKDSSEIDGDIISEVKQGKDGASIKLADRMKALQWLGNHMDLATAEQQARIDKYKAETAKIEAENKERAGGEQPGDDGFLEALNGSAMEDWDDET